MQELLRVDLQRHFERFVEILVARRDVLALRPLGVRARCLHPLLLQRGAPHRSHCTAEPLRCVRTRCTEKVAGNLTAFDLLCFFVRGRRGVVADGRRLFLVRLAGVAVLALGERRWVRATHPGRHHGDANRESELPVRLVWCVRPRGGVMRCWFRASSAPLRDLLDAPTALAACCGFDLCHKYILYLYLYLYLSIRIVPRTGLAQTCKRT
jgi:hypothetical protein